MSDNAQECDKRVTHPTITRKTSFLGIMDTRRLSNNPLVQG